MNHILHKCNEKDCFTCNNCLAKCDVCRGAESSLPTDCPGHKMMERYREGVANSEINFINGKWYRLRDVSKFTIFPFFGDLIDKNKIGY